MNVEQIVAHARDVFAKAEDIASLENAKARFLGKTGELSTLLKTLGALDIAARKREGARMNVAKQQIEDLLRARRETLKRALMQRRLTAEAIDVTLPGRGIGPGALHPVMNSWERAENIFRGIGFDIADGPEIETEWTNFTALNSPENHPARSMQDTFYIDAHRATGERLLLRTHTSPMQIRYARAHRPPLRVLTAGRTYRVDSDATHAPMFHQVEGLWIDERLSFAELKGVYIHFLRQFFERDDVHIRFRPSYFPFTEPSAEIDMKFEQGRYAGRWLEVSGAGQVHPNVLHNMGLDPERYMGFAFGSGLERLTMLRYGIEDLRLFFEGDVRFLKQFA
ncbi:Phenylalanyl-tRNA synthetase alpha chain (Phenylalanine--tRNA ligase alpha chain) (PheRS) [Candidatus Glomeribacter gigasporarum BEG34]|uniref:Phenylalanine--tRNA ligase alpha subunit n=1 Tax=Candidatus Glomeribacter gigasporarum BEG34 TaxID=1070319 RepID=G2J8C9_9BURK|nr:phenylalanine--tRNA ligase subunit alpha [Candidatus Glomeribacter gigasporarum]CCD29026.1 Phenylalanyl-tRNA synthetase alpha chain (Phenylalanine--tRNA ligase alpha chain) (PheRS) [Candidatus Glomeribacter gigasporarum BEG34]